MKKSLLAILTASILTATSSSFARGGHSSNSTYTPHTQSTTSDVHVRAYDKADGTHVPSHYRTRADETQTDNYSSKGNVNPYTGKTGTKDAEY